MDFIYLYETEQGNFEIALSGVKRGAEGKRQ
jgi:hypothetical protein